MKTIKLIKLWRYILFVLLLPVFLLTLCYVWISFSTRHYLYSDIKKLPKRKIGLVLGTNKYLKRGGINQYYQHRIDTAVKLYRAGKVKYFIVSGANRQHNYNEPRQMREDLITAGMPEEIIQPDYAGLRTLDSVLRIDKIFGHKDYLIISQRFHNQRAVFLARHKGQTPIAFNAPTPARHFRVMLREWLARVRAIIDLATNKQARHYGDPIIFPPIQLKSNA